MKTPCKFEPPEKHDDPFVSTAKFRETANLGEKSGLNQLPHPVSVRSGGDHHPRGVDIAD